ncbi:hypothetical protein FHL15_010293 [Xylaria flabelliformis]|uniref:Uncharacterized protein n=1 Tax=Xylaria flabelliformis TaxID=2512241 RepID=A0A553HLJ2_9PEZI|nr:hypothetical protein FHL15_010293 [Xylaria flabelliformis]
MQKESSTAFLLSISLSDALSLKVLAVSKQIAIGFSKTNIPYLTSKTAIVTSSNSWIGKQTVAVLAAKGAKVYLGARSHDKYITALGDIHASNPPTKNSNVVFLEVDLSSAASAKASAERFKS